MPGGRSYLVINLREQEEEVITDLLADVGWGIHTAKNTKVRMSCNRLNISSFVKRERSSFQQSTQTLIHIKYKMRNEKRINR